MPELTLYRLQPERTPVRMICMYCGKEAHHRQQWLAENPRSTPGGQGGGGGVSLVSVPDGNDPVSGFIALMMLPIVLWELLMSLFGAVVAVRNARNPATPQKPPPPLDPPSTLVTVTTCGRHRKFSLRFVWAGIVAAVALAVVWYFAVQAVRKEMNGAETMAGTVLLTTAVIGTVVAPLAISFWYTLAGPVIVDRADQETVTLDRVREAYFNSAGIPLQDR